MKTLVLSLVLLSQAAWAVPKSASCFMQSRGNETTFTMTVETDGVLVQMGDGEPDKCVLEDNSSYTLHARCGTGDDAVFFGVKGSSGKVYASFGTVATLKNCRIQN